ncbi:Cof-type HAD-IIB family hydrolase [Streptococcaceae bacterium ESL0729]|nr:Cof-type HAD-IIB family hydrolase [Streptococcaceae bacterium ESL0729]
MIKLLALDLDGTLLDSQKKVSDKNRWALDEARKKGVKLVITTGRPLTSIKYLLEDLDLIDPDEYSITFNGGLVQRNTGEILSKSSLSLAEIKEIHKLGSSFGLPLSILSDDRVYELDGPTDYRKINPALNYFESSVEDLPSDRIYNKAIFCAEAEILDSHVKELQTKLASSFESFKSRDIIFEVMPKGVVKATGLKGLIDILNIDQSEVMAIGDEENDRSMIEWAGYGMAMANAVDLIKDLANHTIPLTNDQDGVAWAIEEYIL